jgi:ADP-heptose:LPS heptosyltransferase
MKILVILASGIGNSILFGPTLITLRKNFPKAKIDIFSYKPQYSEPFKGSDFINNIIYYSGFKSLISLRRKKYDVSITAFPSNKWQFNLFVFLVGAKKRITHSYKFSKFKTLSFLQNIKIPANEKLHDVDQNLNLLKSLKLKLPKEKNLIFHLSKENKEYANEFIEKNNLEKSNIIGIHPGAGPIQYKKAPIKKFIELIRKNITKNSVLFVFGTKEEISEKKEILKLPNSFNIETNLKNSAALIKKCNLFITNDTGLMHIASTSQKTKIIALFNGTTYSRTRPYTKNSEVIILRKNILKYPFRSTKI